MHLQFSTASLPYYPLSRHFATARMLGLDGLELALTPALLRGGAEEVRRLGEQHGVAVRSLQVGWLSRGAAARDEVRAIARFAAALPGCQVLVLATPHDEGLGGYLDLLRHYGDALAGQGIALTIENPAPARPADTAGVLGRFSQLRGLVEEWDLGYTFDTSRAAAYGWVITEPLPQMGARLRNVHLSDFRPGPAPRGTAELPPGGARSPHLHQLPGEGILPLRAFLRALCRRQYAGLLTLDVQPRSLRVWWPPTVRHRLARACAFCRTSIEECGAARIDLPRRAVSAPVDAENEG